MWSKPRRLHEVSTRSESRNLVLSVSGLLDPDCPFGLGPGPYGRLVLCPTPTTHRSIFCANDPMSGWYVPRDTGSPTSGLRYYVVFPGVLYPCTEGSGERL